MPGSKDSFGRKKWTRAEYFARSQNTMIERTLTQYLTQLARSKFEMRVKRAEELREVRETVQPIHLTTGYSHKAELPTRLHNKRVTFQDDQQENHDPEEYTSSYDEQSQKANKSFYKHQNLETHEAEENDIASMHLNRMAQRHRSHSASVRISYSHHDTPERPKTALPDTHPSMVDMERKDKQLHIKTRNELSLTRINSINEFYLAKMKKPKKPSPPPSPKPSNALAKLVWGRMLNAHSNRSHFRLSMLGQIKEGHSNGSDKTTVLDENHEQNDSGDEENECDKDDTTKEIRESRQMKQMPKLYLVYQAKKERFRQLAAELRQARQKSDTNSVKSTDTGGTEGSVISSTTESTPRNDHGEAAELSDQNHISGITRTENAQQNTLEISDIKDTGQQETVHSNLMQSPCGLKSPNVVNRVDIFVPTGSKEYEDADEGKETNVENKSGSMAYLPTQMFSIPISSMYKRANTPGKGPCMEKRHSIAETSAMLEEKSMKNPAVPIAKFVRHVKAGLSVEGIAPKVSDLRVPTSKSIIRREMARMVKANEPRKVSSDAERKRMEEIEARIAQFLNNLPNNENISTTQSINQLKLS